MTLIRIALAEPNQFLSCSRPTLLVLWYLYSCILLPEVFLMPFAIQRLGCFRRGKMIQDPRENTLVLLNCVYSWLWTSPISQHGLFLPTFPPWFSFCCDELAERKSNTLLHLSFPRKGARRKPDIPRMLSRFIDSPGLWNWEWLASPVKRALKPLCNCFKFLALRGELWPGIQVWDDGPDHVSHSSSLVWVQHVVSEELEGPQSKWLVLVAWYVHVV